MGKITQNELALKRALESDVDNFDNYFGGDNYDGLDDNADKKTVSPSSQKPVMGKSKYNPPFKAQFDLTISIKYFQEAAGVFTSKTAAQIIAAVAATTQFPVFVFGNSDINSGYKNMIGEFPVAGGWAFQNPFVYGRELPYAPPSIYAGPYDANVTGILQRGDMVLPYTITSGGNDYLALVIIRCKQTGYNSLLQSINSDKFVLNQIRYIINTATYGVNQYNNDIKYINQSLFGKRVSDSFSPTSYKNPEQMQDGIIDIPLKVGVDKETCIGSYIDYDTVVVQWSIFVWGVKKA